MRRLIGLILATLVVCTTAAIANARPDAKLKLRVVVGGGTVGVIHVTAPAAKPRGCLIDCTYLYPHGTKVTLHAFGAANVTHFVGWSGACKGKSPICAITLSRDTRAVARFALGG